MVLCFILLRCLDSVAQFSANNTFVPWCFIMINRHRATADLLRGIPGLSRGKNQNRAGRDACHDISPS